VSAVTRAAEIARLTSIGWRVTPAEGGFDVVLYSVRDLPLVALPFGGRLRETGPGDPHKDRYGMTLSSEGAAWDWIVRNSGAGPLRLSPGMREGVDYRREAAS
jgi:hypothetical protein